MAPGLGGNLSSMRHTQQPGVSGFACGHSSIFLAAKHDDFAAVAQLIFTGCPLELRDPLGNTALHIAAQAGHLATVQRLVHSGASLAAVNRKGLNAAQLAQLFQRDEVTSFLSNRTGGEPVQHGYQAPARRPNEAAPFYAYRVTADDIGGGPTWYTQR
eukprot:TRINITY_DN17271_c0_g1_i1.p1 TRINITY_DN17271_c0_g1~~TRINITY_DN17271_c0_g1_i1.p1  ORF type:complete len:158 (+),score=15.00 TRINITY_DN17271_c0_g1_i1:222-695(+)